MDVGFLILLEKERERLTLSRDCMRMLNLEIGKQKVVRILDNCPIYRNMHFFGKGKKPKVCEGDGCPLCGSNDPGRCLYCNVLDREDGEVKILCARGKLYRELVKALTWRGDPSDDDLVIERTGSPKRSTYSVRRLKTERGIPEGLKLFDLERLFERKTLESKSR